MAKEHNCDDALAEGFIAGAILTRDNERKRLRDYLIKSGDVVFHLNDLLILIDYDDAGAF